VGLGIVNPPNDMARKGTNPEHGLLPDKQESEIDG